MRLFGKSCDARIHTNLESCLENLSQFGLLVVVVKHFMAYIFTRPDSDIVMMAKIEARETSCKMIFD